MTTGAEKTHHPSISLHIEVFSLLKCIHGSLLEKDRKKQRERKKQKLLSCFISINLFTKIEKGLQFVVLSKILHKRAFD